MRRIKELNIKKNALRHSQHYQLITLNVINRLVKRPALTSPFFFLKGLFLSFNYSAPMSPLKILKHKLYIDLYINAGTFIWLIHIL